MEKTSSSIVSPTRVIYLHVKQILTDTLDSDENILEGSLNEFRSANRRRFDALGIPKK